MREEESDAAVPFAILYSDFADTDSDQVTRKGCCATVTADSLGRYFLTKLNPGDYELYARRSRLGKPSDSTSFTAVADTTYRIDFHLAPDTTKK